MITFDLRCTNEHLFEGWFHSGEDFLKQQKAHLVQCPICATSTVEKALQAPAVLLKKTPSSPAAADKPKRKRRPAAAEAEKALHKISQYVHQNFEDVGQEFPDEARKIHYGETEKRGIYGQTDAAEEKALREEGIPIMKIRGGRSSSSKNNGHTTESQFP